MTIDRPAFPYGPEIHYHQGLTRRELFAAMAMQGMCTHYRTQDTGDYAAGMHPDRIAKDAVAVADALLKELDGD